MLDLHPSEERGRTGMDWLESRHSFSFAGWHEPGRMGFRSLRVLNEDRIAPGTGFGPHPHRDMEILTIVLAGALEHRDSSGARSVLRAGDVQRMSAGRGVLHSEWNASDTETLHLLQIWLRPARLGLEASHEEARGLFPVGDAKPRGLRAVAAAGGGTDVLRIHQDAVVYAGRVDGGESRVHPLAAGRGAWVQAVRGALVVNGAPLAAGDGLGIENEPEIVLSGSPEGDLLLFDLA